MLKVAVRIIGMLVGLAVILVGLLYGHNHSALGPAGGLLLVVLGSLFVALSLPKYAPTR